MANLNYHIRCDKSLHCTLHVASDENTAIYVVREKTKVVTRRMDVTEFKRRYPLVYKDYELKDFATKLLSSVQFGTTISPSAKAHLNNLFLEEPNMAKFEQPDAPTTEGAIPTEETAKPKRTRKPKVEGEVPATTTETVSRNRRSPFDTEAAITVIGTNPARPGTTRHAIVTAITQSPNVGTALRSTVTRADATEYKISLPDIYFALERGIIEVAGFDAAELRAAASTKAKKEKAEAPAADNAVEPSTETPAAE